MLNKIMLMGRLTRDPELRHTQNNTPVAGFSLAVERTYSKEKEKETDFFDIVAWRNTAEFASKNFKKGQLVCVDGRLQRRQWTDNEGNNRYAFEVVADSVHFAGYNKVNETQDAAKTFDPFYENAA